MKTKAHIRYKNSENKIIPGATTIIGLLAKPALIPWANRLGLQGIDVSKFVDDKADIGTLGHAFCTDHLKGITTDTSDYDKNQISLAENAALSFFSWLDKNPITPIIIEEPLVSNIDQYGGTIDIYGTINGKNELIDLKTGNGIWPEHLYQVSAYKILLEENGYKVDQCRVLNIPRSEDETFLEKIYSDNEIKLGYKIFQNCLSIYWLKREMKLL